MLSPGATPGPSEILSLISSGGMGDVHKARDTRLDRIVAINVSAQQFSERFEREARADAALNHPHTLCGGGPNDFVMEYIGGEPRKGPVPGAQAVQLAPQILDAAHRKGMVSRYLKPANVLATRADGSRFLVANPVAERSTVPVTVVLNWPALVNK